MADIGGFVTTKDGPGGWSANFPKVRVTAAGLALS
jgi:hypothetical protein